MLKYARYAIVVLQLISPSAFSQWTTKTVTTGAHPLTDIFMVDQNTGYAGASDGIYKTTNGGANWQLLPSFSSSNQSLESFYFKFMADHHLHFINATTGYSVGWGGLANAEEILKTDDGGTTWTVQHYVNPDPASVQAPQLRLRDLAVLNTNEIVTVGYRGRILKTNNGGNSWSAKNVATDKNFETVQFINSTQGIAAGDGVLARTSDGGETWTVSTDSHSITDLHFFTAAEGIAVTLLGKVITTSDGGTTWTEKPYNQFYSLTSISFVNDQVGFICGNGIILKTIDGGKHFDRYGLSKSFNTVQALAEENVFLTTTQGEVVYSNGASVDLYPLITIDQYSTAWSSCANENFTITNFSDPGYAFTWYVDNSPVSTAYDFNHSINTAGIHKVKVVANNGQHLDSLVHEITIIGAPPLPNINLLAYQNDTCSYEYRIYAENAPLGETYSLYNRNDNTIMGSISQGSTTFTLLDTTHLYIKISATNECATTQGEKNLTINVAKLPYDAIIITAGTNSVCPGDSTYLQLDHSEEHISYTLFSTLYIGGNTYNMDQVGKSQAGNGGALTFNTSAINQSLQFVISAKSVNNCEHQLWSYYQIIHPRKYYIDFEIDSLYTLVEHDIQFTNNSTADTYVWDFGEGATPATSNLKDPGPVRYTSPGEKTITLIGTAAEGCSKTLSRKINILSEAPHTILNSQNTVDHLLDTSYRITDFKTVNGNYYLTGLKGLGLLYPNAGKFFVAKFNKSGQQEWMMTRLEVENATSQILSSGGKLFVDEEENIFVTGSFSGGQFSIGDHIYSSHNLESIGKKGIILKLNRKGKICWGDLIDFEGQLYQDPYRGISPTDLYLENETLYVNLVSNEHVIPILVDRLGERSFLEADNNGNNFGVLVKMDTSGAYKDHLEYAMSLGVNEMDIGSQPDPFYYTTRYLTNSISISNSQSPRISVQNGNVTIAGSFIVNQGPWGKLYLDRSYKQDTELTGYWYSSNGFIGEHTDTGWKHTQSTITSRNSEPVYPSHSCIPRQYNTNITGLDQNKKQRYLIVSQVEQRELAPNGDLIMPDDSIIFVDGGFVIAYNENYEKVWENFLPYGELIGIQVVNSDIYLLGNFTKRVGAQSQGEGFKGFQSTDSKSIFLAKYNSEGVLQWINDIGRSNQTDEFAYSLDYDPCANKLVVAGVDFSSVFILDIPIDNNSLACNTVAFSASSRRIAVGKPVHFTDLSRGVPITAWSWTFEGAKTSSSHDQNPTDIIYLTPGSYPVSLTVTGSHAATGIKTVSEYILVEPLLTADFSASILKIETGETVDFADLSVGNPTSWKWNFEGATKTTSTIQHPKGIQYNVPGIYAVSLTVKTAGQLEIKSLLNYITVVPAFKANFTSSATTVATNSTVDFFDHSVGNPTSWQWSFQGAETTSSMEQNPKGIRYKNPGMYTVSLNISTTSKTNTKTLTEYITVYDALVANFSQSSLVIAHGGLVDFTDLSTGNPDQWHWMFQGGQPSESTEQNPEGITYSEPGNFPVYLQVVNSSRSDTSFVMGRITVDIVSGTEQHMPQLLNVFPNPNKGEFMLTEDYDVIRIEVYNSAGIRIEDDNLHYHPASRMIKLKSPSPGLYVLRLSTKEKGYYCKVMIE